MNNLNNDMKDYIINWGFPDCLKNSESKYEYKFDRDGIINTNETDKYEFGGRNFKFSIWDPATQLAVFTMDFFKTPLRAGISNPFMILELIFVHLPEFRKKGIASYYINKMIQFAIEEHMDHIEVTPNAYALNFKNFSSKNALSQQELVEYYRKWDSPEMPFIVLEIELDED